jgi:hypothetical protein
LGHVKSRGGIAYLTNKGIKVEKGKAERKDDRWEVPIVGFAKVESELRRKAHAIVDHTWDSGNSTYRGQEVWRMIEITAIRMSTGGTKHEHITNLKWKNTTTNSEGSSTRQTIVDWLDKDSNQAIITSGSKTVFVGVVRPVTGSPYVRTYADGIWTDNLLALPRY